MMFIMVFMGVVRRLWGSIFQVSGKTARETPVSGGRVRNPQALVPFCFPADSEAATIDMK